uniref:Uncharacterized protein n=1 Tax=Arundo donax TaxID=35708 RepID=A0A0A8Z403_ARUDO
MSCCRGFNISDWVAFFTSKCGGHLYNQLAVRIKNS